VAFLDLVYLPDREPAELSSNFPIFSISDPLEQSSDEDPKGDTQYFALLHFPLPSTRGPLEKTSSELQPRKFRSKTFQTDRGRRAARHAGTSGASYAQKRRIGLI